MAESVPVRCPECRHEHIYTPPVYPCDCGAPVTLPLLRGGLPVRVRHRTWRASWVQVRCPSCGTSKEWPQPELGCACGTTLRLPVATARQREGHPEGEGSGGHTEGGSGAAHLVSRTPRAPRPAFSPVTIRTAQDARAAAAQYLRWLGFTDVRVTEKRAASGVDVRGPGIVAHVDPTTSPTAVRAVETLWLNALNESSVAVCFSLAGYVRESRARADALAVSLFVIDLTGTPQPVNDKADELIRSTA
jgi:hypothetical protein